MQRDYNRYHDDRELRDHCIGVVDVLVNVLREKLIECRGHGKERARLIKNDGGGC